MNEEIPNRNDDFPRENPPSEEWQAPPPPIDNTPAVETPQMSEVGTLGSIFFEPGATFEDLRRKPRFAMAMVICIVVFMMFSFAFVSKVGYERIARERLESSSFYQNQPPDAQQKMVEQQGGPIAKYISFALTPVFLLAMFFIGGLLYWGGANAMGGSMSFLRGVAVYTYSSFPPWVVSMLANLLILFLKSPDDIDAVTGQQQGLIQANPSFFIDAKATPVLAAVLGTFDVFLIWGWILAVIGLRIVGKISTGAAAAIVIILALIFNVGLRVVGALFS